MAIGDGRSFEVGKNGVWGPMGFRSKAPGEGFGGRSPQKLTTIFVKICHFVTVLRMAESLQAIVWRCLGDRAFSRFSRTSTCARRTDRRTDRQTHDDS